MMRIGMTMDHGGLDVLQECGHVVSMYPHIL